MWHLVSEKQGLQTQFRSDLHVRNWACLFIFWLLLYLEKNGFGMKRQILIVFLGLCGASSFGQVGNFRSLGTGPWGTAATWERDADSNGSFEENPSTVAPTAISGTVTIQLGHTVTFNVPTGDVNSGGTVINNGTITFQTIPLRVLNVNSGASLQNNGVMNSTSASRLKFNSGSTYIHLFADGGVIPSAQWDVNSTVRITGMAIGASTRPGGLNQIFGNFTWNTPAFDNFIDLEGQPAAVNGDFTIVSTGAGAVVYNFGTGLPGNNNATLTIGGDLVVQNGAFAFTSGLGSTGSLTVNNSSAAGKGIKVSGGYLQIGDNDNVSIALNGVLSVTGGDLEFSSSSSVVSLDIIGNYTFSAGNVYSSGGTTTMNFTGLSTQTVATTLSPVGNINYVVDTNAILSIPNGNFLGGTGSFTLASNGSLHVGSTDLNGAIGNGSIGGNVRVTGVRTYTNPSTITFNGVGPQFIGNGHPTSPGINTVVNNPSGVSLIVGVPAIITTDLTLTNGNLNVGNGMLTLNGTLNAGSNNITVGTGGSVSIGGAATIGTFPFPSGAQSFTSFTLDNPNGITFNNDVTLSGTLTLTTGTLHFPGRSLTLNGTFAGSGSGDLSPSSTSSISIGGSGAFGSLRINTTNNTVGTLTMARSGSGTASLNSTLIVSNTFNLTNGSFTNLGGLQMANNSTLIRNSNAQLLGSSPVDLPIGESYSVTYTGSTMTTGLELPSTTDNMLQTLNIGGGPVTLNKNIIVNGSVNLSGSTLQASTFSITLAGSSRSWNQTFGGFTPGTGSVIVTGSYTIVGISPVFGNLTVNSGASLTMLLGTVSPPDPGNVFITGDFTVNAGSTFNANNGTVYFSGSAAQNFSGGGKTFNNILVDKTGGSVSLSSAVNLVGVLDIETSTTLTTNSHLTLISNASGTASIASIPTGGAVSGDVTVQRYAPGTGRDFRDISSPVFEMDLRPTVAQIIASGITITGNFTGSSFPCAGCATNNASLFFYDESVAGAQTLGYTAHPPNGGNSTTSILSPGRGYSLLYRNELGATTLSLTAPINAGGRGLPVSYTNTAGGASEDGWNLVGNPYPSQIDWDAPGWTKTAIQGNQISVWDPNKGSSGGYRFWNGSAGDLVNGQVALGQGFWVKAINGTVALSLTESVKNSVATSFYRTRNRVEFFDVSLRNTESGDEDNMYVQISDQGRLSFDPTDGVKKLSPSTNLFSVLTGGEKLSINSLGELPVNEKVHIGLENLSVGIHRLSINIVGSEFMSVPVYLFDRYLNKSVNLKDGPYLFEVTQSNLSQSADRFYLYFSETSSNPVIASGVYVFPVPVENELTVLVSDESVESGIQVVDQLGRSFGSLELKEEAGVRIGKLDMSSAASGLYFVRASRLGKPLIVKFVKR